MMVTLSPKHWRREADLKSQAPRPRKEWSMNYQQVHFFEVMLKGGHLNWKQEPH